jgi:hypothetical protein
VRLEIEHAALVEVGERSESLASVQVCFDAELGDADADGAGRGCPLVGV